MTTTNEKSTDRGLLEQSVGEKIGVCFDAALSGASAGVFLPHALPYTIRNMFFSSSVPETNRIKSCNPKIVDTCFNAAFIGVAVGGLYLYANLASNHREYLLLPAATNALSLVYEFGRILRGQVRP